MADSSHSYEVLVIGAGLAGLTAGLVAARQGRSALVIESTMPGGHLVNIGKIEDFPGFPEGVAGYDLGPLTQEQAANAGAEFTLAEVESLEPLEGDWLVRAGAESYRAPVVIVAAGSRSRALGVPGEERLFGRGVSHCASCDGPMFQGETVAVVGGGDSAFQEALTLAEYAARVLVLHRSPSARAQQTYQRRVAESPVIQVRPNIVVEEMLGDDRLTAVRAHDLTTGQGEEIEAAGAFVYIGLEPNTDFLRDRLVLDREGRIPTDIWLRTSLPGIFAAGDIRSDSASQAIAAAGDGATAAIGAARYLEGRAWPVGDDSAP